MVEYTEKEWKKIIIGRFGENVLDWKAYGLFKLGDVVITDDGTEIDVFPIADEE